MATRSGPRRYLLPSERRVIQIRRHWAVLFRPTLETIALIVFAILVSAIFSKVPFLQTLAWWIVIVALARLAWIVGEWWVERFIVTDQRVMLISGIVTRKVAIMPLAKVTDMTYERSLLGQMLGYGAFIVESAGQVQALSTIRYIPHPDRLYVQVSEMLFGPAPAPPTPLV